MKNQKKYFLFIACLTIIFCLAIGFDSFPALRGPAPYPPEWQWPYLFVNTLSRIYLPLLSGSLLVGLFLWEEKKNILRQKHTKLFIFLIMLLSFFFQLSLLFFSRSGVGVLLHRIINPGLNGYFTASLTIHSVTAFLANYNHEVLQFVYHAKAHPPGAILLFYCIKQLITPFTFFVTFANQLHPTHTDVGQLWNMLQPLDKATAVAASILIPFLSTLSLIPLYFSAVMIYGSRVALRTLFIFFFIPTIVFFIPINDAFLHVFSITAFFFLVKGVQKNDKLSFALSGTTLFLGVFFNLSLLPLLILFLLFCLFFLLNKKNTPVTNYLTDGVFFSLGFFLPPLFLAFFFHFNFLQVTQTIMSYVPDVHSRSYTLWLSYNISDFLIFCGIPLALTFLLILKQTVLQSFKKQFNKIDPVFLAFLSMIIILNFSGSVRGETGRLWSPYIPFMVLVVTNFVTTKLKFSTKVFAGILLLQILQLLFMQEFWVMLW